MFILIALTGKIFDFKRHHAVKTELITTREIAPPVLRPYRLMTDQKKYKYISFTIMGIG